jgi:hypothetical protein
MKRYFLMACLSGVLVPAALSAQMPGYSSPQMEVAIPGMMPRYSAVVEEVIPEATADDPGSD